MTSSLYHLNVSMTCLWIHILSTTQTLDVFEHILATNFPNCQFGRALIASLPTNPSIEISGYPQTRLVNICRPGFS